MSQRQVVLPALDVGHHSFNDFLDERLSDLKMDLLRECDRIAAARELLLKKQLAVMTSESEGFRSRLEIITSMISDFFSQKSGDEDASSAGHAPLLTKVGNFADVNCAHPAEVNPACSPGTNGHFHEEFHLWAEWVHAHGPTTVKTVSGDEQIDFEEDYEEENEWAWNREPEREAKIVRNGSGTLSPNSHWAMAWEVLGIPVLFYDLVTIPMQVFYAFEGLGFEIIGWVLILYWTGDIFLRLFFIGYVDERGTVKQDRKGILKRYLRRSFTFDFFMVAPDWFTKVVGAGGMRNVAVLRLFRILRLMRLMRMSKMKKMVRDLEDLIDSEFFAVGISIMNNLFGILFICHYLACFWYWVGTIRLAGDPSWVDLHLQGASWEYEYVISLHWAIAQFTPGASKVQPSNILEAAISILVLIFGLIFLSLFISALTEARAKLQGLTSKMDRDNWILRRYLRQQNVSSELTVRTMRYVEKCLEPMMCRVQRKDVFLLPLLSRPLQLEVQEEQFFHTLIAHPLLKSLRERSLSLTLHLFVSVIIEILLADSDLLFEAGSVAHEMYFVSRGELAYLHHISKNMTYVDVGGWCCEPVLFVPWVHNGTAKAAVESHIISIDSAKFRAAVLEHRERTYVSKCANGFFRDLNALVHSGEVVTDVTQFSEDYQLAISGKSVSRIISAGTFPRAAPSDSKFESQAAASDSMFEPQAAASDCMFEPQASPEASAEEEFSEQPGEQGLTQGLSGLCL